MTSWKNINLFIPQILGITVMSVIHESNNRNIGKGIKLIIGNEL